MSFFYCKRKSEPFPPLCFLQLLNVPASLLLHPEYLPHHPLFSFSTSPFSYLKNTTTPASTKIQHTQNIVAMFSLFLSFQCNDTDGRHCLYHGTTIKSMRIVHSPSRKICFHENCSHWYFLISMRYECNQNLVAQMWQLKSPTFPTLLQQACRIKKLEVTPLVLYVRFCQAVFPLSIGRP